MRVLVACEFSGTVRDAFAKLGHDAWSVDLLPSETEGNHFIGDALKFASIGYPGWDLLIAHPPCTYLTTCDAPNWKKMRGSYNKLRYAKRLSAMRFFVALYKLPINRICIENPQGVMNTRFRKPDQIIQPFLFGHPITKRTCFWLKNLPPLNPTNIVDCDYGKDGHRIGLVNSSVRLKKEDRWKVRSKTFQGIADAMADQWGSL